MTTLITYPWINFSSFWVSLQARGSQLWVILLPLPPTPFSKTFKNIRRYFGLSRLRSKSYWHLVGKGQDAAKISTIYKTAPKMKKYPALNKRLCFWKKSRTRQRFLGCIYIINIYYKAFWFNMHVCMSVHISYHLNFLLRLTKKI